MCTDLDMKASHNHIALHLARTVGVSLQAVPAYLLHRQTWHDYLLDQEVDEKDVKQLWVSLLNGGTLAGLRRNLLFHFGMPYINLPC